MDWEMGVCRVYVYLCRGEKSVPNARSSQMLPWSHSMAGETLCWRQLHLTSLPSLNVHNAQTYIHVLMGAYMDRDTGRSYQRLPRRSLAATVLPRTSLEPAMLLDIMAIVSWHRR